MFASTFGKGFQMTFENGVTISVQFGHGDYCNNHKNKTLAFELKNSYAEEQMTTSATAELAIWKADGQHITGEFEDDENRGYIGWASAELVADAIVWAKNYK